MTVNNVVPIIVKCTTDQLILCNTRHFMLQRQQLLQHSYELLWLYNNNNNNHDDIYSAVIIAEP